MPVLDFFGRYLDYLIPCRAAGKYLITLSVKEPSCNFRFLNGSRIGVIEINIRLAVLILNRFDGNKGCILLSFDIYAHVNRKSDYYTLVGLLDHGLGLNLAAARCRAENRGYAHCA